MEIECMNYKLLKLNLIQRFPFFKISVIQLSPFLCPDPFAVKRNVARSVSSQQMYEYIVHCLKTTYKYFALPPNAAAAALKKGRKGAKAAAEEPLPDLRLLGIQPQDGLPTKAEENGPDDVDCIIEEEEEEEAEEYSDSDEDRDHEKVDVGKSSVSEDEEDEDASTLGRQHLDSFTTEEEIFPVDEISGEDLLSEEEGPDADTSGSADEDEEEEELEEVEDVELAPVNSLPAASEDSAKGGSQEDPAVPPKPKKLSYDFTKQAFTRGKVGSVSARVISARSNCANEVKRVFCSPAVAHGGVQLVQA